MNTGRRLMKNDQIGVNEGMYSSTKTKMLFYILIFIASWKEGTCSDESFWLYYWRHIVLQLENLLRITEKVYPNCRKTLFCHIVANIRENMYWQHFEKYKFVYQGITLFLHRTSFRINKFHKSNFSRKKLEWNG